MIFRGPDGRSAFAKPRRASRSKLVVTVPPAVARLVAKSSGAPKPTRFKLRVLAGKFSKFTSRRLSPVVVPANSGSGPNGGGGGGASGCPGQDYDGDLLSNALEAQLKLDPCIADTDGDSVEDGYEYQAALDLNHYPRTLPLPYPGKRPYPNPLDPADGTPAGTDYDGDGLKLREEFLLWLGYSSDGVGRPGRPGALAGLVYSDGLQRSVDSPPPSAPGGLLGLGARHRPQRRALGRRARRRRRRPGQLGRGPRPDDRGVVARSSTTARTSPRSPSTRTSTSSTTRTRRPGTTPTPIPTWTATVWSTGSTTTTTTG